MKNFIKSKIFKLLLIFSILAFLLFGVTSKNAQALSCVPTSYFDFENVFVALVTDAQINAVEQNLETVGNNGEQNIYKVRVLEVFKGGLQTGAELTIVNEFIEQFWGYELSEGGTYLLSLNPDSENTTQYYYEVCNPSFALQTQDDYDLLDKTFRQVLSSVRGNVFESYISELYYDGIISGYSNGDYGVDDPLTREQFAKILVKALELEPNSKNSNTSFNDEQNIDSRLLEYVNTLASREFIGGYSNGNFGPQDPITRGQVVKILVGFYREVIDFYNTPNSTSNFSDISGTTFADEIKYLEFLNIGEEKVINGYSDGTFKPDEQITRGQVAKIVSIAKKLAKASGVKDANAMLQNATVTPEADDSAFCGTSTNASCETAADCMVGGCSGQVCMGAGQDIVTTCEFRDCYNASEYNVGCGCVNGQCAWAAN